MTLPPPSERATRLTAWARLAILVTILWIAGAGYTRYRNAEDGMQARTTAQFQACSLAVEARGAADYKSCFEATRQADQASRAALWTDVAIGALAPPAGAWILYFLGALAARWVLGGRRDT